MKWSQTTKLCDDVLEKISTDTITKKAAIAGGIASANEANFYCPGFLKADFEIKPSRHNPKIAIKGLCYRRIKSRPSKESPFTINVEKKDLSLIEFNLGGNDTQKLEWLHDPQVVYSDKNDKRSKKLLIDSGMKLVATLSSERRGSILGVTITVSNETKPEKASMLQSWTFEVVVDGGEVVVPEKIKKEDVPLFIETVNIAVIDVKPNSFKMSSFGIYDQKRKEPKMGARFLDITKDTGLNPADFSKEMYSHFNNAFKICSSAMAKLTKDPEGRYYLHQQEAIRQTYMELNNVWNNKKSRAFVTNTPTFTGKSEINYITSVSAVLVLKGVLKEDPGTVSILIEPIRVLASEQTGRIFKFIAYINEQLPEKERISMGFYMGFSSQSIPFEPSADINLDHLPISDCPYCGEKLDNKVYNEKLDRLIPHCSKCNKNFDWVYLSLRESGKFLPNILVATLDKICYEVPRAPFIHTFFGRDYIRCKKCNVVTPISSTVLQGSRNCPCGGPLDIIDKRMSRLSVFAIDEAHSFKGSLGSYAGLFLTVELKLLLNKVKSGLLVTASTATVKNADVLLKNLTLVESVKIFPNESEMKEYFDEKESMHRRFCITVSTLTNRYTLPYAACYVKQAWDGMRSENDPEKLPQVIFTRKKADGENLKNMFAQHNLEQRYRLVVELVHGDLLKPEIEAALRDFRNGRIDVLISTIDLLSLGLNIAGIAVVHFNGMDDDYSKFVQAYGRSARTQEGTSLVFLWLRRNLPGEAYYFEHFRDLFIYEKELMPIIPINKWFPDFVRNFLPSGIMQYVLYTDERMSSYYPQTAINMITTRDKDIKKFLKESLQDTIYPEDRQLAENEIDRSYEKLSNDLGQIYAKNYENTKELMKKYIIYGIRGSRVMAQVQPSGRITRALISARVERGWLRAGYKMYFDEDNTEDE